MSYPGRNWPNLENVLNNGDSVGSGNKISFDTIAISGASDGIEYVISATDATLIKINDVEGTSARPQLQVGDTGMGLISEFGGQQMGMVQNATRRAFVGPSQSINMQFGRLIEVAHQHTNTVTASGTLASQTTGGLYTNVGATGLIQITLPPGPTAGWYWRFFNSSPTYPLRIIPGPSDAFITPTGLTIDGKYLELSSIGASVYLIANNDNNLMVFSGGDVNIEL